MFKFIDNVMIQKYSKYYNKKYFHTIYITSLYHYNKLVGNYLFSFF